jgi:hypothetical protein
MPLLRFSWKSRREFVSFRAVVMCIATLGLLARCAPPDVQQVFHGSVVNSQADHGHKPCFDHEDYQWLSSPSAHLIAPAAVESPQPVLAATLNIESVTDGWHYNRPPPAI